MKTHHYRGWEFWYDRSMRTWYAIQRNAKGDQIGEALDAYTKEQIKDYIDMEMS